MAQEKTSETFWKFKSASQPKSKCSPFEIHLNKKRNTI